MISFLIRSSNVDKSSQYTIALALGPRESVKSNYRNRRILFTASDNLSTQRMDDADIVVQSQRE